MWEGTCSMARTMDPNSANSQFSSASDDAGFLAVNNTGDLGVKDSAWKRFTLCQKAIPPAKRRDQVRGPR